MLLGTIQVEILTPSGAHLLEGVILSPLCVSVPAGAITLDIRRITVTQADGTHWGVRCVEFLSDRLALLVLGGMIPTEAESRIKIAPASPVSVR